MSGVESRGRCGGAGDVVVVSRSPLARDCNDDTLRLVKLTQ